MITPDSLNTMTFLVALIAGLPAIVAVIVLYRIQLKHNAAVTARIEALTARIGEVDLAIVRSALALDGTLTEANGKVLAELKSLEILLRVASQQTRENPEMVDAAIRLAREGVPTDLIVARTGLPITAVESIVSLHSRR
jgi:hypothetical protein